MNESSNSFLFDQKVQAAQKQGSIQTPISPISPRRKTNQTIEERFLLKHYTGPVIFKQ